jgi:hypothetical protein
MASDRGSGASAWMGFCSKALTWQLLQKSRAWQTAQHATDAAAREPWPPFPNPGARCDGGMGNRATSARVSVRAAASVT